MAKNFTQAKRNSFMRTAAAGAIATMMFATPAQSIVPNDNFTPADISDPEDSVNGVGQFFRNDGFVCTGTLINPRTVLFAAHCVNDRPESDYDTNGTIQSAFSFNGNALPGFINWINNGFASNPDLFVYNISRVSYHPDSLVDPNAFGFLEADIALATLDSPAQNIPTWALLFSPLPDPGPIDDTDGTGYHVKITGYGRSGSGTTGASVGIDWRRKSAENMLGSLTSFNDRNQFLFGNPFGDLPQVLYRLDFDDPNKTNPFDFNLYKDEPRTVEGTTAGGDSGGPLILDAANNDITNEDIQIGVLSGGSRFFGGQVFSSYGTESFYQPLFLFAEYIAAENPYRYVSAKAGDGNWEDATHWQTDLDPAYRIIDSSGAIVNGFPDAQSGGVDQSTPQFGEVCFDPEGDNPGDGCQDLATGDLTPPARPAPAPAPTPSPTATDGGNLVSGIGTASMPNATSVSDLAVGGSEVASEAAVEIAVQQAQPKIRNDGLVAAAGAPGARAGMIMGSEHQAHGNGAAMINGGENMAFANGNGVDFAIEAPQNGVDLAENQPQAAGGVETAEEQPQAEGDPLPAPTIDNGLAGATDFVPDNQDADPATDTDARYFEVTLNQAGVTTLNSRVTIDRLNVGGDAGLVIADGARLRAVNDVNQTGGRVAVDGRLTSVGDYTLFSGLLSGTGNVRAPFLTNIAGGIAPGTMGGIGTLDITGNVVLASGSTLFIDVGPAGTSDLLRVNPTFGDTSGDTGNINLGGNVAFATTAFDRSSVSTARYRIVESTRRLAGPGETLADPVTGTFNPSTFSAILTVEFLYGSNFVDAVLGVGSYQTVVDGLNPVQVSYAALLDRNRGGAAQGLLDTLDFQDAATIQATLDSWAPTTESTVQTLGRTQLTHISDFYQNRTSLANRSSNGGTVAVMGRPLELASASIGGMNIPGSAAVLNDAATNATATALQEGGVNEDMAVYLAGGFINGDGGSMPLRNAGAGNFEDEFDGFFIAGGLEYYLSEDSFVGFSGYYSDLDANVALGQQAEGRTIMGSIYGRSKTFMDLVLDARVSVGTYNAQTLRNVALGAQTFNLTTDDDSFLFAGEIGLTKELMVRDVIIAPGIRGRAAKINFSNVTEVGGGPALTIIRPDYNSVQGLAGVEFKSKPGKKLQLRASMNYVHEFQNNPNSFGANFAGGAGLLAPFALVNPDRDWGEVGVGLRYNTGNMSIDLSADSTVGRSDVKSQVYSGAVTFRF